MGGFERLERIVTLNVTYKTLGNLSINTGRGDGIRDNLVIRGGGVESDPVISGSSVKGVVRSTIEALLTQASESQNDPEKERLKVCIPLTCFEEGHLPPNRFHPDVCVKDEQLFNIQIDFDKMKNEDAIKQISGKFKEKNRSLYGDLSLVKRDNKRLLLSDGLYEYEIRKDKKEIYRKAKPCLVCQMFGNTKHKGRIIFHDAKLPKDSSVSTISRTHVAINRNTGTASSGALMTIETVPTGAEFSGSIVLINPEKWMVGAIYEVMKNLVPKIGIGAKTTNGYGELEVTITPELTLCPQEDREEPNSYISSCLEEWNKLVKVNILNQGD